MAGRVEIRLLGRVEVCAAGSMVPLRGSRLRTALATLATYVGKVVPTDRLISVMWPDTDAPSSATGQLHTTVWRLRQLLGDVVETDGVGYRLRHDRVVVDAAEFEERVVEGRAASADGRHEVAAAKLADALALWRGDALSGVPGLVAEARRLEELRLTALATRLDADLELGRHADIVAELTSLAADHPYDERFHAQLMLALHRCGRSADAFSTYDAIRSRLREELGADPGERLREVHRQVLAKQRSAWEIARSQTRYVRSGDVHIAYQVVGEGSPDIVFVPGLLSHLDLWWDDPVTADFFSRLAGMGRVIMFDKRGTGLSDRVSGAHTFDERMDDVRAVMDACDSENAVLFGYSEGGPMSLLFAAMYPGRVAGLVLASAAARWSRADDYPYGPASGEAFADLEQFVHSSWGLGRSLEVYAPSVAHSPRAVERAARRERMSASPSDFLRMLAMVREIDVRSILPTVRAPALVIQRADDQVTPREHGRFLANNLPNARYFEQPGDHLIWVGDTDRVIDEIGRFVGGLGADNPPERMLATVLVCRPAIDATELIARHRGVLADTGGSLIATFDGAARAVECAQALTSLPAGRDARIGLHAGEIDAARPRLHGPALDVATHVADLAEPGTVLASRTVRDLVLGSSIGFEPHSRHRLVVEADETWDVFAVSGTA